ncbi:GYD domain-containing protein [Streptacidiphilus neutrinimicus]|uniref:GYD domain-containing protein n=1 Tax=Streptacidiphilus neutrinimicus TaxID=105420 RepID=UPI0005AB5405|nr:GYD domain-containing protein [Streptacidiphilus neutrinimicus]
MATFISLVSWTDQGVRDYQDTTARARAFAAAAEALGAKLREMYWTVGPYDMVVVVDAPDDETATAVLLQVSGVGNVRTVSMRAYDAAEMDAIIAKATG